MIERETTTTTANEVYFSDDALRNLRSLDLFSSRYYRGSARRPFRGGDDEFHSPAQHVNTILLQTNLLKLVKFVAIAENAVESANTIELERGLSTVAENLVQREVDALQIAIAQALVYIGDFAAAAGSDPRKSGPSGDRFERMILGGRFGHEEALLFEFLDLIAVSVVITGQGSGVGNFLIKIAKDTAPTYVGGLLLAMTLATCSATDFPTVPSSVQDAIERSCGNNITISAAPPEVLSARYRDLCAKKYLANMSLYDDDPTGRANTQYALSIVLKEHDQMMEDGIFGSVSQHALENYKRRRGLGDKSTREVLGALADDLVLVLERRNSVANWPGTGR